MSDPIQIPLELTDNEWAELYYAIDSKMRLVDNGTYGDEAVVDTAAWVATLRKVRDHVHERLVANHVAF